ncbi:MAG: cupin domain-containing protein [Bacteroidota bacterium]
MGYFVDKEKDVPAQEVWPGIIGRLVHTEHCTIADFQIVAGTKLPAHAHPHEQTSTVLTGRFRFTVGGETKELIAGQVAVIPGNVEHSGEALTDCRIIDVFSPVREDYRVSK